MGGFLVMDMNAIAQSQRLKYILRTKGVLN